MKKSIRASIQPDGGDDKNFWMFYTGPGYPVRLRDILNFARRHDCTTYWWGSENGYSGMYNGDTFCVCKDINKLGTGYRADAIKFGKKVRPFGYEDELDELISGGCTDVDIEDFCDECNLDERIVKNYIKDAYYDEYRKLYYYPSTSINSSIAHAALPGVKAQYCETVGELVNALLRIGEDDEYMFCSSGLGRVQECQVRIGTKMVSDPNGGNHEVLVIDTVK